MKKINSKNLNEKIVSNKIELLKQFKINNKEFNLICDISNGIILDTSEVFCRQGLIIEITDCNEFQHVGEKWEVDVDDLISKLNNISYENTLKLLVLVGNFWNANNSGFVLPGIPPIQALVNIYAKS